MGFLKSGVPCGDPFNEDDRILVSLLGRQIQGHYKRGTLI